MVVVCNAEILIALHKRAVQIVALFIGDVRFKQGEEDVQLCDFIGKQAVAPVAAKLGVGVECSAADLHDIDTILRSEGTATITATTVNGLEALCEIPVDERSIDDIFPEEITLSRTTADISVGNTLTLRATILPANATDKTVTWGSSDTGVATVDDDGVVTGLSEGTATITATTVNDLEAMCEIKVDEQNGILPEEITLNRDTADILVGSNLTLTATILPDDATDKTVTWSSSDTGVAIVDEDGVVTGVSEGAATITATTVNDLEATCEVTVNERSIEDYP
jgi:uncharacterized protein YjdB